MSKREGLAEILDDPELAEKILAEAAEVSKSIMEQGVEFKAANTKQGFGGATTIGDAIAWQETQEETWALLDLLQGVIQNIMAVDDEDARRPLLLAVGQDFQKLVEPMGKGQKRRQISDKLASFWRALRPVDFLRVQLRKSR